MKKLSLKNSFLWVAGLAVLPLFCVSAPALAAVNAPTGAATATTTTSTVSVTWASGGGDETYYALQQSTSDCSGSFADVATTTTSTLSYTFSSLSPNVQYCFRVAASDGVSTSTFSTTSAKYTLANQAGTPFLLPNTTTSLYLYTGIDYSASNPTNTTYAFFNTTTGQFVSADGSPTSTPVYQTTSTWGGIVITGLSHNTAYSFAAFARNGDNVTSSPSALTGGKFTAVVPATVVLSATGQQSFNILINLGGYSSSSRTFAVQDNSGGVNYNLKNDGTWTTSSASYFTYAALGGALGTSTPGNFITTNTLHTITVTNYNGNGEAPTSSPVVAVYTLATAPTNLSVAVNSATQLTATWSGDGTRYDVFNSTANSHASVATTTYTQTGLSCGVRYFYTVTAYNGDDVATSGITANATTNACGGSNSPSLGGGGGSPATPTPTPVVTTTPAVVTTTPATTSPATTPVVVPVVTSAPTTVSSPSAATPELTALNNESEVVFTTAPKLTGVGGNQKLTFAYGYTNNEKTTQTVRLVRELVNAKGKVVSRASGSRVLKPGKGFVVKVTEVFNKKTPAGMYYERIKILDKTGKTTLEENSFTFTVVAPVVKKK